MAIPEGGFSSPAVVSALLFPDSIVRTDTRVDFERGGVALSDPTQGYNVRDWMCGTDGSEIWVSPYPEQAPRTVFYTGAEITEVSLAFDQNMAPTLVFVEDGVTKLRWFNTLSASWEVTVFANARSPMLTLDDKREFLSVNSDIIFAYISGGNLCYRLQRDRYNTEYVLGPVPSSSSRLVQLGMGDNNRLQFKVASAANGAYVDISSGDMFIADGEDILQTEVGADQTAVWRSRVYTFDAQPSFAWARVEAEGAVSFKLYADGALLYHKPSVTSNVAFRLPPKKAREWYIEIEGAVRAQSVTIASSTAELGR